MLENTFRRRKLRHLLKTKIDDAYIDQAIKRGDIESYQKKCLARWKEKTVAHAVDRHVQGAPEPIEETTSLPGTIIALRDMHSAYMYLEDYPWKPSPESENRRFCPLLSSR